MNNAPQVASFVPPGQYEEAWQRVRAEFIAQPQMILTAAQAERLFDIDSAVQGAVFIDLVRTGFLYVTEEGAYAFHSLAS